MAVPNPYSAQIAATEVRQERVTVLGSDTRYWDYGPLDAPLTMVAIHGFRGEHHGLEPVVAQLRGIRVISPDLPGFGESTPFPDRVHDIDGYSTWLGAFIESLGLAMAPVILGHSFGSIIVSGAIARGLSTPRLILINPIAAPALKGPKALTTALAVFYFRSATWLPERLGYLYLGSPLIVRFVTETMAVSRDKGLRRWIHDQHLTYFSRFSDRKTVLEAFTASTSNNVIQFASSLTMPTLLIAAAEDPITKVADERTLAAMLPDATLHVIEGVGHLIHYETPREAAGYIVDFIGTGALSAATPGAATR